MEQIKKMLLGIGTILITIVFHLMYEECLWTDFIAILGFLIVMTGYYSGKDTDTDESE